VIVRHSLVVGGDAKTGDQERRYRLKGKRRPLTEAELLAAEYAELRTRTADGRG
jgi:hypothetical protein